jgi:hypothetical protein
MKRFLHFISIAAGCVAVWYALILGAGTVTAFLSDADPFTLHLGIYRVTSDTFIGKCVGGFFVSVVVG